MTFQTPIFIPVYLLLAIALFACSSEDDQDNKIFDHPHAETIDMEKHLFEHEFAKQCIAKESAKQMHKTADHKRFAKPCMCIAKYMFKDLAAKESYSLLNDKQQVQFLRQKYIEAAKHCL